MQYFDNWLKQIKIHYIIFMKTCYYQLTYDYQNDCDPTLKIKKLDNNNSEREY